MRNSDVFVMSLGAIGSNKLRSFLTLVGIVLGVASIIGVMTAISVMQATMEKEMTVLGTQTFQVQKWPNGFTSNDERREAQKWPPVTLAEAQAIRDQVSSVDLVGTEIWDGGKTATYKSVTTEPVISICGGSPEYPENNTHYVEEGRNLSRMDMLTARKVVVIGHALAEQLFPFTDPIGKEILLDGRKFEVIGVFIKKVSAFGGPYETMALMPSGAYTQIYGMVDRDGFTRSVNVTVHSKTPALLNDAIEQVRQVMRTSRHLKHDEKDNFYYFTSLSQIDNFNKTTMGVKIGAFLMGAVALLVAGIGIMNIMLVSVTERTKEIGIRKSLGAKRKNILAQFLLEAVVLCNVGGVIGIALGFLLGNLFTFFTSFEARVPIGWAVFGVVFCSLIGVVFGMIPAIKASRLNPIDALHYE
ncbi:MAG TPA: ABC transporter permease [Arenimonas sp.]|uniref:ABC transporter permease n=1 Tax=Arenimonas sp. TaxID=1872635 RepID=UPI002BCD9A10|nr:ABC transporter permease [Arenimonas sp.]HMB57006.1 ABC transporter permease [Arenimonas sp.]